MDEFTGVMAVGNWMGGNINACIISMGNLLLQH